MVGNSCKQRAILASPERAATVLTFSTQTGLTIKYVIWGALVLLIVSYFLGGYVHARRRLKKGLPPLGYHRVNAQ